MSLKDKKSLFDRNQTGREGNPVGQNPPSDGGYFTDAGQSPSPFQSRTGDHLVDLLTNNVKSTNTGLTYTPSPNKSDFQDLDGAQGPQFQLPQEVASQRHIDSLKQVPGGSSNSPFQDRLDGGTPSQYLDNLPS